MGCHVTACDPEENKTSSVLGRNQYFDSEADFCRVYSEDVLLRVERRLMRNQISYYVREEGTGFFARIFGGQRTGLIVRINESDMETAMDLAEGMRGVEIIGVIPEEDWTPVRAKARRDEERAQASRFREVRKADDRGYYRYDPESDDRRPYSIRPYNRDPDERYYDGRFDREDSYEQDEQERYRQRRAWA